MKYQGVIKTFAILFALVCIYHLSFTFVANRVEKKAMVFVDGDKEAARRYLDSISGETVYNLLVKKFNYAQVKERELNLGLDLQGGMSVVLEVSLPDLIINLSNESQDADFLKAIEQARDKQKSSNKDFVTLFAEEFKAVAPAKQLNVIFSTKENKDRVSFNTGDDEVIAFLRDEAEAAIDRTFQIISTRINKFGVSQPNIMKLENSGRIQVELPGVDNPERVRKLLQGSAKLEFWDCYTNYEANKFLDAIDKAIATSMKLSGDSAANDDLLPLLSGGDTTQTAKTEEKEAEAKTDSNLLGGLLAGADSNTKTDDTTAQSFEDFKRDHPLFAVLYPAINEQNMLVEGPVVGYAVMKDTAAVNQMLMAPEVKGVVPPDLRFFWGAKPIADGSKTFALYALKESKDGGPGLEGDVVTNAQSTTSQGGAWEISMTMNIEGAKAWQRMTAKAASGLPEIKRSIAIVLDGVVYSAPTVQGEISGGRSSITGNFTQEESKDLANILKAGKLPAPSRIVEEAVVGPSLGREAINSGLLSILVGFLAVVLIMFLIYNHAGIVADIAVLLNLFFIMGVLSSLGAALTLPGIAGIILTLGMAVDANVLIFERVKEELVAGRNLKTSVVNGFRAARSAILDANITTLLAAFVLLIFGSGPIYGFAVTLIIGILCSLFTAILIARIIIEWRLNKGKDLAFYFPQTKGLLSNANFDFIGKRKIFYAVSGLIIAVGIGSLFTKGLELGVDFKGGYSYVVKFENNVTAGEIRNALAPSFDGKAPDVKSYGSAKVMKITTKYLINDNSENASDRVAAALTEGLATLQGNAASIESSTKVGPTIADDITRSGFYSLVVALIGMFIYIMIRFRRWQFALSTVVKLIHDVLVILALFSILPGIVPFSMEIDQSFIAAILTVIGYSINDSVVVFDRVREYLNEHKYETHLRTVINNALNSTLSRTLVTSLTTFVVVFALFLFGGEVIRGFAFALCVGVVSGTYSSLCIGTPLAAELLPKEIDEKQPEAAPAMAK